MRIIVLVGPLSLVYMILFGIIGYSVINNYLIGTNSANMAGIVVALIAAVIAASLVLGLSIWHGVERLLSYSLKRLVADMQQICDGGKLSFTARKHKKDDPIGLLYEYYAKVIGVTDEFLSDITDISQKRKKGETGVRLNETKYKGSYFGAAQNVNNMMSLADSNTRFRIV